MSVSIDTHTATQSRLARHKRSMTCVLQESHSIAIEIRFEPTICICVFGVNIRRDNIFPLDVFDRLSFLMPGIRRSASSLHTKIPRGGIQSAGACWQWAKATPKSSNTAATAYVRHRKFAATSELSKLPQAWHGFCAE
jgi:hypothetical protein